MCGLAGLWTFGRQCDSVIAVAHRMADTLTHRGPDDFGVWSDDLDGPVLVHRRLSIQDVSVAGHQPMVSSSRRYVIAFNGEIYNQHELRSALPHKTWRGHSDTETLLTAIDCWGLDVALARSVGMFSIALWDRSRQQLTLVRDRFGEKPLYYCLLGDAFLFGSELKAFTVFPSWKPDVDRDALALYLRYGYVPMPHTIWQNVRKLLPGSYLTITLSPSPAFHTVQSFYWQSHYISTHTHPLELDDVAAVNQLDSLLQRSVSEQLVSDLPIGAFLSGGIDSSTIAGIMQSQSSRPVQTFSIGFTEADYDEAIYAMAVAKHLGTDHTELYLEPSDALRVIPQLANIYDEPFGDSSQIPTHLVSLLARRHVSVCLSGDAGDELFGGYNRYVLGASVWHRMKPIPRVIRQLSGRAIRSVSPNTWDLVGTLLPRRLYQPTLGDRLHKFASVMDVVDCQDLYLRLVSHCLVPDSIVISGSEVQIWADRETEAFASSTRGCDVTERMMFQDLVGFLSDDILTKVDRASMATSLETRIPMLDHRLVEFAWSLPLHMKIRDGQSKWLLRQVLSRYVPQSLIDRPKQGFSLPIDRWLRGPLRDWAEALLQEDRLRMQGFLHPEPIRQKWLEHLSGRRNWQHFLWNVLMFQAWHERWV